MLIYMVMFLELCADDYAHILQGYIRVNKVMFSRLQAGLMIRDLLQGLYAND